MDRLLTFEYRNDDGPARYVLEGESALERWPNEDDRTIGSGRLGNLGELVDAYHANVVTLRVLLREALCLNGSEEFVWDCLNSLLTAGISFWEALLGRDPEPWLEQIYILLTKSLGTEWWRSPSSLNRLYEVQVRGPSASLLPLDLMPLGTLPEINYGDPEDLAAMASLFGGFVARVRYTETHEGCHVHPPATGPRELLNLRSTEAPGLELMQQALDRLGSHVVGPYPTPAAYTKDADVAMALLTAMPTPVEGSIPDVVHLYSHGYTFPEFDRQLVLDLAYGNNQSTVVTGNSLAGARRVLRRTGGRPGPIVILNACHSLGRIGTESFSFATILIRIGARAVVGSRDQVPAPLAVYLADYLLQGLDRDLPVGHALLEARWRLLLEDANPLGLLYATFGDIDTTRPFGGPTSSKDLT